jgi:hypothetical protein
VAWPLLFTNYIPFLSSKIDKTSTPVQAFPWEIII